MKLSEIDQEKIDKLNEEAMGFIILANKKDSAACAIVGDFTMEDMINMGMTIINKAIDEAPEHIKDHVRKTILMTLMNKEEGK